MAVVDCSPLSERLAEVIEEFSECNDITIEGVLDALEYTYACVERFNEDAAPKHKLH